jgi:hypothetical protein
MVGSDNKYEKWNLWWASPLSQLRGIAINFITSLLVRVHPVCDDPERDDPIREDPAREDPVREDMVSQNLSTIARMSSERTGDYPVFWEQSRFCHLIGALR